MTILVNLIPIKKGGGQQVASNFVNQILDEKDLSLIFLVTKNSYIHQLLKGNKVHVIAVKNNIFKRLFFQKIKLGKVVNKNKIDVIYTMFGPGLHFQNTISITGCAYSNIFFPEIDFWKGYSFLQKIKIKLIDRYRLNSTLKSNAIVFENEAMQKRAVKLFNFPEEKTKLILPSISEYRQHPDVEFSTRLNLINDNHFNIVLLTGWHKNKNIEILPFVLVELKKQNYNDISFVITVSESHPYSQKLLKIATEFKVNNNLFFLNSVAPHNIPHLFEKIDAVALFSLLESFSNNIIEAWFFKKPLFISNEEWSRAICKNAAVYVDRNSAKDIADKIISYRKSLKDTDNLIEKMEKILLDYPSPKEKVYLQLEFIKEIYSEKSN